MLTKLKQDMQKLSSKEKAKLLARFFKTGKGEYGYGDIFLGITVPETRNIAKKYSNLNLDYAKELLKSKIHEHRLVALLILIEKFRNSNEKDKGNIINFYLAHTTYINNWDLVDLSSHQILGNYLMNKDKSILYKLAKSDNLWEKRISIISTAYFIKNNKFQDTLNISKILLKDKHDLVHKAVGWMLREIGKRNLKVEEEFLKKHYKQMPRTTLRYAIEKFSKNKREFYLKN